MSGSDSDSEEADEQWRLDDALQRRQLISDDDEQALLFDALQAGNNNLVYSLIAFDNIPVEEAAFAMAMVNWRRLVYSVLELVVDHATSDFRKEIYVTGKIMRLFVERVDRDIERRRSTDGAADVGAKLWRCLDADEQMSVIEWYKEPHSDSEEERQSRILNEMLQRAAVIDAEVERRRAIRQSAAAANTQPSFEAKRQRSDDGDLVEQRASELLVLARAREGDDMMNAIAVLPDEQLRAVLQEVTAAARRDDTAETRAFIDDILRRVEAAMTQCNNTVDSMTQESVALADDLVQIHWANSKTAKPQCYSRAALWAQISASNDVRYYVRDPTQTVHDDEGRGYIPGVERVVRVGESNYVSYPSLSVLLDASNPTRVFRSIIIARNQRIGNAAGNRGVGDLHGQAPGETIHWLEPPALFSGATTPPRRGPRTKTIFRHPNRTGPWIRPAAFRLPSP
jgi:ElaB/YqjD/DUF883 family membrane-anchored ribosome-binding protein